MRRILLAAGLMVMALLGNASAAAGQVALGVKVGTTGVGGDISFGVTPRIALRAGATLMPIKPEGTYSDVTYQVEMPGPLLTANADIYLMRGLRVMGGVLVVTNETTIKAISRGTVNIGGQSYSSAELGELLGQVSSQNVAPFVGIGFGKTVGPGFGVTLDISAASMGEPALALGANGACSQNPQCNAQLQSNLRREAADILDEIGKYGKVYPMISLGLRFGLEAR